MILGAFVVGLLSWVQAANVAPSPSPAVARGIPALLQEVEVKYGAAKTLAAEFSQTQYLAVLEQTRKSGGVIRIKRPDKVVWDTSVGEPSRLVSNGVTVWLYTPPFADGERGQVLKYKASGYHSRLAHALLAGSFSAAKDLLIETKSATEFVVTPRKKGMAGTVKRAEVVIDPDQKLIKRVILEHEGGNRADIDLSNVRLGADVTEDEFNFKAPSGTEEVNAK